jgi:hypothetical protein
VGFRVLHVLMDKNGMPIKYEPFLAYQGPGDTGTAASFSCSSASFRDDLDLTVNQPFRSLIRPEGDNWPHRPVGLDVGHCASFGECLYVSSDASGVILAVGHE